jgi:hypothetical protein
VVNYFREREVFRKLLTGSGFVRYDFKRHIAADKIIKNIPHFFVSTASSVRKVTTRNIAPNTANKTAKISRADSICIPPKS